mgnify:CR=1 FL=1
MTVRYAPYKATYAIVRAEEDLPDLTEEARDKALGRAVNHVIEDGKVWCQQGQCEAQMCLPRIRVEEAPRYGDVGSEPLGDSRYKRCYVEIYIEVEVHCECGERVKWFDIPEA